VQAWITLVYIIINYINPKNIKILSKEHLHMTKETWIDSNWDQISNLLIWCKLWKWLWNTAICPPGENHLFFQFVWCDATQNNTKIHNQINNQN
jgi:hypothetical protein